MVMLVMFLIIPRGYAAEPPCDLHDVPASVQQVVHETFPEWRIWDLTDLTDEDRAWWLKRDARSSCPGLAIGHFLSKKHLAYAMFLIPKDSSQEGWRLVVIDHGMNNSDTLTILERTDSYRRPFYLWTAPPATYSYVDEDAFSKALVIRLDSVGVIAYEGRLLWYWVKGQFHSLFLAD
ncbi:MAG: hypothetical protein OEY28_14605 [Nitrospira sp.]|nr:hypothetical protein [Nitrospira sp.]